MMPLRRLNQGDGHIMIRRLLDAFVLTVYELRNLILFVKDKAMVNAPMGVLYAYLIIQGVLHIHLRGAFVHCSFRRIRAMRRPIDCGTSKKCGSTFFVLCTNIINYISPFGSWGDKKVNAYEKT